MVPGSGRSPGEENGSISLPVIPMPVFLPDKSPGQRRLAGYIPLIYSIVFVLGIQQVIHHIYILLISWHSYIGIPINFHEESGIVTF